MIIHGCQHPAIHGTNASSLWRSLASRSSILPRHKPHQWEPNVTATKSGSPLSHYRLSSHKAGSRLETKHDIIVTCKYDQVAQYILYVSNARWHAFFQHLLLISVGLGNSPHVRFTALGSLGQFPSVVAGSCACLTQTPRYTKVK